MSKARLTSRLVLIATLSMLPLLAFAAKPDNPEPVGHMSASASGISWATGGDFEKVTLRVMTPDGVLFEHDYTSAPTFRLQDLGGKIQDGKYTYELRVTPKISDSVKQQLALAREAGDDATAEKIQRAAGIGREVTQSGTLTVSNGAFVNSEASEPANGGGRTKVAASTGAAASVPRKIAPDDIVQADDVIIQGSLCVGLDCVNNESFGFDTIRLKENNTRIKFDDTSTGTGFPNHDWQLTANDSASGGANKFSVEDITAATVPMTITGSAPTNSIFVDSTGRVGFRTSTPVLDLHVATSNTPALRLEQNNSGGFTAQTWDVAGNEANFFVRDVTGGSRLPFRIRPGAPTSSIDIAASGKVGMGTASPSERLHVFENADVNSLMQIENPNTGTTANATLRGKADVAITDLKVHGSGRTIVRFGKTLGSWSEMLNSAGNGLIVGTLGTANLVLGTNSTNRMEIDGTTGAVTVSGNFTVTGVKNFAMPDPADSKRAIYYASLEGPEAGTYFRGTGKTVNGEAVIELPGFFSRITENDRMTVQLTPVGAPGQLYVSEKTPQRLVIKVAAGADIEFDYLVQGVRKGYLDYQVERDNKLPQ